MNDTPSSQKPSEPEPEFVRVAECLYRNRSSGTYYGLVKRSGKQYRQSLKTKDRKMAERKLRRFREKASRLTSTGPRSRILFAELAKQWLERSKPGLKPSSHRRREVSVTQLNKHFGKLVVRNLTARDCDEWVVKRADRSASTFNNERETLRLILDYACRDGILLDNPALSVDRRKAEKQEVRIPTREEFARLVAALRSADPRYREAADLVELLAYSGMRLGEATELRWKDVDFAARRFTVTGGELGTKNHEARVVPFFPSLEGFLSRLKAERNPNASDKVVSIATAKKALATTCRKAGLPDYSHHALRHFFVSNAIEQNVDFKAIAGWIGHKDGGILVAKTYGHLRDTHSADMALRMVFHANQDPITPPEVSSEAKAT